MYPCCSGVCLLLCSVLSCALVPRRSFLIPLAPMLVLVVSILLGEGSSVLSSASLAQSFDWPHRHSCAVPSIDGQSRPSTWNSSQLFYTFQGLYSNNSARLPNHGSGLLGADSCETCESTHKLTVVKGADSCETCESTHKLTSLCVCPLWFPALVPACAYRLTIASLCNTHKLNNLTTPVWYEFADQWTLFTPE